MDQRHSGGEPAANDLKLNVFIDTSPELKVRSGVNVKLTCSGTTDPEEIINLRTIWRKDHEPILLGTRMFLNKQDNSLTISGTEQRDTGTFTCVITNDLDNDTASARLVVTEYSTILDPNHWVFAKQVKQTDTTAIIPLSAGMDYKFRVTSYNKIGPSKPSEPSNTTCTTKESVPTQNPRNLRTIGDIPGHLHIHWTPVPPEHQGGRGCFYVLTLMRLGQSESKKEIIINIRDWQQFEYIYSSSGPSYQPYQITIQSVNPSGNSLDTLPTIIGYSSDGPPQISPYDLLVLDVNSESVTFQWKFDSKEIGKTDSKIRGEFMGFKVQFWLEGNRHETIRDVDIRPSELDTQFNIYNTSIKHQMPNSRIEARIALLNYYYVSPPSDTVKFITPSGLPGSVQYLEELNIADNHMNLMWLPPLDNRGDLEGYDIAYQEVEGLHLDELQERQPQIDDPFATTVMLSGLQPNRKYRIYIWARTAAGRGEGYYIERSTTTPGHPKIPKFSVTDVGRDCINVSWWRDPYVSSGTVVFVEYRKKDGGDWLSSSPDVSKDWAELNLLQPGMTYVVRLVAITGDLRRISGEEEVRTDGTAKAYDITDNLGWLLSMVASILIYFSLLIGLIICHCKGFSFRKQEHDIHVTTDLEGTETYTETQELSPTDAKQLRVDPFGHINRIYQDDTDGASYIHPRSSDNDYEEYTNDGEHRRVPMDSPPCDSINDDVSRSFSQSNDDDYQPKVDQLPVSAHSTFV
ncbi:hypothetical protein Btru_002827 [Bulinus truncatus]|nr:hypothetical protein Btru_002827 [Bulinus truncatus]